MRNITQRFLAALFAFALVSTAVAPVGTAAADPGGDFASECSNLEKLAIGVTLGYADLAIDCLRAPVDREEIENKDDVEAEMAVYKAAAQGAQGADITTNSFGNYMEDAGMIGRMEGQNGYIRALEEGDTIPAKSVAEAEAKAAVNQWFSNRSMTLVSQFKAQHEQFISYNENLINETNETFVKETVWGMSGTDRSVTVVKPLQTSYGSQQTITLPNGTSVDIPDFVGKNPGSYSGGEALTLGGQNGTLYKTPPKSDLSRVTYYNATDFNLAWLEIQRAHEEAINETENFIDATYSGYQQGKINISDLITPSLADRNYSPDGDSGVFTQRALTRMGYSLPTDFSSTKTMAVAADGDLYTGVLLSDGIPDGGFEIGTTYDVANVEGKQFVQTSDSLIEIEDSFTIQSVQRTDGSTKDSGSVSYTNPDYQTTSIEGYEELMENITRQQAQINARQQALLNTTGGGGGGLFDFDGLGASLPFGGAGVAVAIGAVVVLGLATRN